MMTRHDYRELSVSAVDVHWNVVRAIDSLELLLDFQELIKIAQESTRQDTRDNLLRVTLMIDLYLEQSRTHWDEIHDCLNQVHRALTVSKQAANGGVQAS